MTTILLSAWLLVDERSYNHQINAIIARHMPSLAEAVTRTFDARRSVTTRSLFAVAGLAGIETHTGEAHLRAAVLHMGEYKMSGAEVFGLAFHIGARVAAKARACEVLVSSAVKDLMSQSGIRFRDHGAHQPKACRSDGAWHRVEH